MGVWDRLAEVCKVIRNVRKVADLENGFWKSCRKKPRTLLILTSIMTSESYSSVVSDHCYKLIVRQRLNSVGRVGAALGTVGWPVSQAAFSTLLGVMALATLPSYVVSTCFKTVFLVVSFGTLHALVFLPVFLSTAHQLFYWLLTSLYCSRWDFRNPQDRERR